MKEFVISEAQAETAVLVALITQSQDERKTNEYLDELAFLAETAGADVVKKFTQRLDMANSVTYVGKGKLQEIKDYVTENEEGMVIFDDELSAKQIRILKENCRENIRPYFSDSGYFCHACSNGSCQNTSGMAHISNVARLTRL